ncbi:MAG: heme exporter protein CcmB [Nannocystaceae bacterium]|nr:heme exporter protein CcmB [Nannocystaceae bacterium]
MPQPPAATTSLRSLARQTWLLARNDLRQEMRDFELVATAGFFTLVVLVMFGLSFSTLGRYAQPMAVPGILWLAVAFVGSLTLTRIFDREREADTLRALLAAPVHRLAIYLAKAGVTLAVLLGCCAILVPGLVLMFDAAAPFAERPLATFSLVFLGCAAYATIGTLFAAGLSTSGGKNVLLSVILYPLTSPALMFALVSTRTLLDGHPGFEGYLSQLVALDILQLVVSAWLFESVLVGTAGGSSRRKRSAGRRT